MPAPIEIWEPKWKDKTVLIGCHHVCAGANLIKFSRAKSLPDIYMVDSETIRNSPRCPNGEIDCYAVPLSALQSVGPSKLSEAAGEPLPENAPTTGDVEVMRIGAVDKYKSLINVLADEDRLCDGCAAFRWHPVGNGSKGVIASMYCAKMKMSRTCGPREEVQCPIECIFLNLKDQVKQQLRDAQERST